ncbi:MAG TPA: FixG Ig-like domain-containing protein, partial [Erythrobacter sp.]|nr:FixG Ig-like domain-containing protein [Erythrobacter sp.]
HPRTLIYSGIWGSIGIALLFALGVRNHTDLTVSPDRNPPFMLLRDGSVRNAYTLKLRNMESRPRDMEIALDGLPDAVLWTDTIAQTDAARSHVLEVGPDQTRTVRAYVAAPSGTARQNFSFVLNSRDEQAEQDSSETLFNAPGGE